MGEIADMMIEGFLDCETGEYIDGESPGYPRTLRGGKRNPPHLAPKGKIRSLSGASYVAPNWVRCPVCRKACRGDEGLTAHTAAKHGEPS